MVTLYRADMIEARLRKRGRQSHASFARRAWIFISIAAFSFSSNHFPQLLGLDDLCPAGPAQNPPEDFVEAVHLEGHDCPAVRLALQLPGSCASGSPSPRRPPPW